MTGDKLVDARRMFKHACAFAGCAQFCESEPWNIEIRLPDYTVADIVNSAFACEVFIKALLVYHGKTIEEIHGHKLDILWAKYRDTDTNNAAFIEQGIKDFFNFKNENMFDELLCNIADAFQYWRYIYEKHGGKVHIQFLRIFRKVLREVCCEQLYGMTWNEFINIKNRS